MALGSPSRPAGFASRISKSNSCGRHLQSPSLNRLGTASSTRAGCATAPSSIWLGQICDIHRATGNDYLNLRSGQRDMTPALRELIVVALLAGLGCGLAVARS